jgi:hemolysin activation/secretion protein
MPASLSAAEAAQIVGDDETKAGLEKAAARLQARLREDGYFLATVIVDKLKDGRTGLRVFPGVFDGQAAKVSGKALRVSPTLVQAIAIPVTSSGEPVTADQMAGVTRRLNALPGVAAKAQVGPGAKEGTAQLTIGVAEDDARVYRLSPITSARRLSARIV